MFREIYSFDVFIFAKDALHSCFGTYCFMSFECKECQFCLAFVWAFNRDALVEVFEKKRLQIGTRFFAMIASGVSTSITDNDCAALVLERFKGHLLAEPTAECVCDIYRVLDVCLHCLRIYIINLVQTKIRLNQGVQLLVVKEYEWILFDCQKTVNQSFYKTYELAICDEIKKDMINDMYFNVSGSFEQFEVINMRSFLFFAFMIQAKLALIHRFSLISQNELSSMKSVIIIVIDLLFAGQPLPFIFSRFDLFVFPYRIHTLDDLYLFQVEKYFIVEPLLYSVFGLSIGSFFLNPSKAYLIYFRNSSAIFYGLLLILSPLPLTHILERMPTTQKKRFDA